MVFRELALKLDSWSQRHFGKLVSRYGYGILTSRVGEDDVYFLNFGYEEAPPMGLTLDPADEPDRYCIQLYHRTAAQIDLAGKDVLEVSCGHGGAASYITRTMRPRTYVGLDYNPAGIAFCHRKHHLPGLSFVHGDAENLPMADGSFDAVINVEAAHLYPDFPRFLGEVARVLRPSGHFLYTDLRERSSIPKWESDLANGPLRKLAELNIENEVLRGLEKNSSRHGELIDKIAPKPLRRLFREISGVEGGGKHQQVKDGLLSYRIYLFVKD
jgi:ubiquinone/menaquinone biosynthesis C-methylase UbiE